MKLISAFVGLAGIALATAPASAMPMTIPGQASQASNIEQASYVCNEWGHCWHRPYIGDGYEHPHYRRWHHWHPYGGYGYGWHHWHRHYYGGWGYGGWHRWHQWHQW